MSLPIWILLKDMPLTNVVFVILENEEMLREIFKSIVSNGKGIEINTSGLRSACNEALPELIC